MFAYSFHHTITTHQFDLLIELFLIIKINKILIRKMIFLAAPHKICDSATTWLDILFL